MRSTRGPVPPPEPEADPPAGPPEPDELDILQQPEEKAEIEEEVEMVVAAEEAGGMIRVGARTRSL